MATPKTVFPAKSAVSPAPSDSTPMLTNVSSRLCIMGETRWKPGDRLPVPAQFMAPDDNGNPKYLSSMLYNRELVPGDVKLEKPADLSAYSDAASVHLVSIETDEATLKQWATADDRKEVLDAIVARMKAI